MRDFLKIQLTGPQMVLRGGRDRLLLVHASSSPSVLLILSGCSEDWENGPQTQIFINIKLLYHSTLSNYWKHYRY